MKKRLLITILLIIFFSAIILLILYSLFVNGLTSNLFRSGINFQSLILDYLPILISIIALSFSYFSLKISQERKEIARQALEETRNEKSKNRLHFTIIESRKWEKIFEKKAGLQWFIVKIIVNNKSDEQVFFSDFFLDIFFEKLVEYESLWKQFWKRSVKESSTLNRWFQIDKHTPRVSIRIEPNSPRPIRGINAVNLSSPGLQAGLEIYLLDWKAEKLIEFSQYKETNGPNPGEKQVWLLYGKSSKQFEEYLFQNNLMLDHIKYTITIGGEEISFENMFDSTIHLLTHDRAKIVEDMLSTIENKSKAFL